MASHVLRRVARNTTSLFASDLINRASTFVLYALVARYFTTAVFGQLSLAFTFFFMFQIPAIAGLRNLLAREITKDKGATSQYLMHGSIIAAMFTLACIAVLLLVVWLMGYAADTASFIMMLSLGLLPFALSKIYESVLRAWEQMHYIAYAQAPVHMAKVIAAIVLLRQGYGLYHLIALIVASHITIAAFEWGFIRRYIPLSPVRFDRQFGLAMLKSTSTFLGIDVMLATMTSLDIILLSKFGSASDVAFFNAARQLLVPMMTVYSNLMLSLFPMLCRKYEPSFHNLQGLSEQVLEVLLIVALPITLGLFFLADDVLLLLYGPALAPAAGILRILVWMLVLVALTSLLGQVLLASQREKVTLRIMVIDGVVSLGCGVLLISVYGPVGAALTALIRRIVDFYLHYVPISKLFSNLPLLRLSYKPVVASMGIMISFVAFGDQSRLLAIACASMSYATLVLALTLWESGGISQLKTRYLSLWVE